MAQSHLGLAEYRSGCATTTKRSPASPPFLPGQPRPLGRSRCPAGTSGGNRIRWVVSSKTTPFPWQDSQSSAPCAPGLEVQAWQGTQFGQGSRLFVEVLVDQVTRLPVVPRATRPRVFRQPTGTAPFPSRVAGLADHPADTASALVAGCGDRIGRRQGVPVAARMWNGLVGVAKETYTASLGEGVVPRPLMMPLVRGLLGPVGRKNSWQIAEHAGNDTPYGLQRLLQRCQ